MSEPIDTRPDHEFVGVAAHPDDDECTHRADGTDATYCGRPRAEHESIDTEAIRAGLETGCFEVRRSTVLALLDEIDKLRERLATAFGTVGRLIAERDSQMREIELYRTDLGAIRGLTVADRPYDWRCQQIDEIARDALAGRARDRSDSDV